MEFVGFTTGNDPWLPVNENYLTVNVEAQRAAEYSPLKIYKAITAARKTLAVQQGEFDLKVVSTQVIAYTR
jgi:oligo-1,6-glucosidase